MNLVYGYITSYKSKVFLRQKKSRSFIYLFLLIGKVGNAVLGGMHDGMVYSAYSLRRKRS